MGSMDTLGSVRANAADGQPAHPLSRQRSRADVCGVPPSCPSSRSPLIVCCTDKPLRVVPIDYRAFLSGCNACSPLSCQCLYPAPLRVYRLCGNRPAGRLHGSCASCFTVVRLFLLFTSTLSKTNKYCNEKTIPFVADGHGMSVGNGTECVGLYRCIL